MILIDTREKPHAIEKITAYFDEVGVQYDRTKLYIGDYQEYTRPGIVVDRKQSIDELAANCVSDRARFKRELERAAKVGATIVVLVEQNRYKARTGPVTVRTIEDLILWHGRYTTIIGEEIFRILSGWIRKYPLRVEFCTKGETGRRILEILGNG
ncbi:MAG: ERCC4 domain-containing protein [Clostridia bacterium]|nr:ERCC4 domain-containing protein [Clostridia bacterium]